jgi:hypothetical protein
VLVAHACNPSYSGGRDQEDLGSKPAQANSSRDYVENTGHIKELLEWLKVKALSSKPQYWKRKESVTSDLYSAKVAWVCTTCQALWGGQHGSHVCASVVCL